MRPRLSSYRWRRTSFVGDLGAHAHRACEGPGPRRAAGSERPAVTRAAGVRVGGARGDGVASNHHWPGEPRPSSPDGNARGTAVLLACGSSRLWPQLGGQQPRRRTTMVRRACQPTPGMRRSMSARKGALCVTPWTHRAVCSSWGTRTLRSRHEEGRRIVGASDLDLSCTARRRGPGGRRCEVLQPLESRRRPALRAVPKDVEGGLKLISDSGGTVVRILRWPFGPESAPRTHEPMIGIVYRAARETRRSEMPPVPESEHEVWRTFLLERGAHIYRLRRFEWRATRSESGDTAYQLRQL